MDQRLTRGDWDVVSVERADGESGWIYFSAARPRPVDRQLFRVSVSGGEPERVSRGPGSDSAGVAGAPAR